MGGLVFLRLAISQKFLTIPYDKIWNIKKGDIVQIRYILTLCILMVSGSAMAQSAKFGVQPLTNEVSLYQNFVDDGDNAGQTLQVVAINSLKVFTDFQFEFTADFNRKLTPGKDSDYYLEIGLVKPVYKRLSLNYQRIYGTFIDKEINQVGVRFRF